MHYLIADGDASLGPGRLDSVQISLLNVDESKINYEMIEMLVHHICSTPEHQLPLGGEEGVCVCVCVCARACESVHIHIYIYIYIIYIHRFIGL
jgi:hypothetical protein